MTDYGTETPSAALARIRAERFIEAEMKRQGAQPKPKIPPAARTVIAKSSAPRHHSRQPAIGMIRAAV